DYTDRKTVIANNKAAKRMYEILGIIIADFGEQGVAEFSKLIDCEIDYVKLWASIQLLERVTVESEIERHPITTPLGVMILCVLKEEKIIYLNWQPHSIPKKSAPKCKLAQE
ncbi:MAG: hypothetical protein ACK56I_11890, partial [bacterium]